MRQLEFHMEISQKSWLRRVFKPVDKYVLYKSPSPQILTLNNTAWSNMQLQQVTNLAIFIFTHKVILQVWLIIGCLLLTEVLLFRELPLSSNHGGKCNRPNICLHWWALGASTWNLQKWSSNTLCKTKEEHRNKILVSKKEYPKDISLLRKFLMGLEVKSLNCCICIQSLWRTAIIKIPW